MEIKSEQRSPEWYKARSGRFTGSRMSELMGKGKGELFGAGAKTYIQEQANEIAFGRNEEPTFISFDMQNGIDLEPKAFKKLKELLAIDYLTLEECSFFTEGDNIGASPDGVISDNKGCAEIKCPKPNKFFKMIAEGDDYKIDKAYIVQMQTEILVTGSEYCIFFNYIIFNGREMWHKVRIERDQKMIDDIIMRSESAAIKRDLIVKQLLTNKQF